MGIEDTIGDCFDAFHSDRDTSEVGHRGNFCIADDGSNGTAGFPDFRISVPVPAIGNPLPCDEEPAAPWVCRAVVLWKISVAFLGPFETTACHIR